MKKFWEKKKPNKSSRPLPPKAKAYAKQKFKMGVY